MQPMQPRLFEIPGPNEGWLTPLSAPDNGGICLRNGLV